MIKRIFWKKSKYHNFWKWLVEFDTILYTSFKSDPQHKAMHQLLNMRLKNVHRDIGFELGFHNENQLELIISASGSKEAMSEITALKEHRVPLQNWFITWLKQPKPGEQLVVEWNSIRIGYQDISFEILEHQHQLGIQLHIRNFEKNNDYYGAVYYLLDCLLGEYDVTYHINYINWGRLDESIEDTLQPFINLRNVVDEYKLKNKLNE